MIDEEHKTDERQADIDIKETKLDYDELMGEIKSIGRAINKANHKENVVQLSDEIFGLGNKMTDATPAQVELMAITVDRLKELASQLGVDYEQK